MRLLIEESGKTDVTYLEQEIVYNGPKVHSNMEAIRLHLYKHDTPTGALTLELLDSGGTLIKASPDTVIESQFTDTYYHGMVRFELKYPLTQGVTYKIRLSNSVAFSEDNYWAWCIDFDFDNNAKSYSPTDDTDNPFKYEIWEKS